MKNKNTSLGFLALISSLILIFQPTTLLYGQAPAVRNNLRVKGILKEDTSILSDPQANSRETDKALRFSPVFIFLPDGSSSLTKDGFYLVGKEPSKPLGWVPESNLAEWDHRLCLGFTALVGRQPALIYAAKEEIDQVLRSGQSNRDLAVAEEPGDLSERRFNMLLPVLERHRVVSGGQNLEAYRIGYLAGGKAPPAADPEVVTQTRANPSEVALLEVMFVLDATASMQPYINGAKKVIESISRSVQSMREAGTRFGLLCYRDYVEDRAGMQYVTRRFTPLTRNLPEVLEILQTQVSEAAVSSEDYPEAMFDGFYAAVTETNWDEDKSSLRIVILVGDAPGHSGGSTKNPHEYSLEGLKGAAADRRIRTIAIKIKTGRDDDELHRQQLQELVQGTDQKVRGVYKDVDGDADVANYVRELTAGIESEIARMGKLVQAVKDPTSIQALPAQEKVIILNNLKTAGKNSELGFGEGWISERGPEGNPQVKPFVFFPFDDLAITIFYLNSALTLATSPTDKIHRAVSEAIHAETGEKWQEGETLEDHFKKKFGLPATSKLLRFTPQDIASWGETRRKDLADSIKGKMKLMETHRDDPGNWVKLGQGDFRYTFVPLEYLP